MENLSFEKMKVIIDKDKKLKKLLSTAKNKQTLPNLRKVSDHLYSKYEANFTIEDVQRII